MFALMFNRYDWVHQEVCYEFPLPPRRLFSYALSFGLTVKTRFGNLERRRMWK
jgi:hypothetical protein